MDARIKDARRKKKDLFILLLDLRDAFGSFTHPAILAAFEAAGIGPGLLELLNEIYTGNTTQLLTDEGLSEEIPILGSVKQGCPLSGLAFNITINPLFDIIQPSRAILHALGYADNTAVVEYSEKDMQDTINRIVSFLDKLRLQLNPNKCKSIHISSNSASCKPTVFKINNEKVPYLKTFSRTKYLGKSIVLRIYKFLRV